MKKAIKSFCGDLKRIVKSLAGKELDPNTRLGFAADVAADIAGNCFRNGDLGGNINSITFFVDDTVRASFLEGDEGRRILSERLRRERIPELLPLADGIRHGRVAVRPLSEAEGRGEEIHTMKGEGPTIRYAVHARSTGSDCVIDYDYIDAKGNKRTVSFPLSGTKAINSQYLFGRKSPRPRRNNSFTLPEEWNDVSRAQGAIYRANGSWILVSHSRPFMSVNNEILQLGGEVELEGSGTFEIGSHRINYRIAGETETGA